MFISGFSASVSVSVASSLLEAQQPISSGLYCLSADASSDQFMVNEFGDEEAADLPRSESELFFCF